MELEREFQYGDGNCFGIEVWVPRNLGSHRWADYCPGRFGYLLGGEPMGSGEVTALNVVLNGLWRIAKDSYDRENTDLFTAPERDSMALLRTGLYGAKGLVSGEKTEIEKRAEDERWARHNIGEVGDVFDGWFVFAVASGAESRVLAEEVSTETIRDVICPTELIEQAFLGCYADLDEYCEWWRATSD